MDVETVDKIYHQMSQDIFTREVLMNTEPIKDSIKTIKNLSKLYDIYIITARTEQLISFAKQWLKENDIEKDITEIISSSYREKQEICKEKHISYLYDDDIKHLQKNKIQNRILFNPEMEIIDLGIPQVCSWKEIEEQMLKGTNLFDTII